MNQNCPDKGKKDGKCNRTRCPNRPATWFSTIEQAYYCEPCAIEINKWVPPHLPKLAKPGASDA